MRRQLISRIPLITSFIFATAYISQMVRMWTEHSALGQSAFGWVQSLLSVRVLLSQSLRVLPIREVPGEIKYKETVLQ